MTLTPTLRAIAFTVLSMACFVINDTFVKLASEDLPIGQIIALRGIFAVGFIVIIAWRTGAIGKLPSLSDPMLIARTLGEVAGSLLYLNALARMPLANANAILQLVPLALTAAAALFLREQVGWRRWTAIAIGFVGVLIIVQPGSDGFNAASLLVLMAIGAFVVRDLATRRIDPTVSTVAINLITTPAVVLASLSFALFEDWQRPDLESLFFVACAGGFLIVAYLAITAAMREGDVAGATPFRYTVVIWALVLDFLVFNNTPQATMLIGVTIVVATGIYTFWREQKRRNENSG